MYNLEIYVGVIPLAILINFTVMSISVIYNGQICPLASQFFLWDYDFIFTSKRKDS